MCLFLCNNGQTRVVQNVLYCLGEGLSSERKEKVQKEYNAAWDQLKKNNPVDEGLTETTNKKIEELRRKK